MIWVFGAILAILGIKGVDSVMSDGEKPVDTEDNWTKFDALFKQYGQLNNVDWRVLKAIALNESSLGRDKSVMRGIEAPSDIEGSKSSDGKSWGLMQVTLTTARGLDATATQEKLNNPEYSIKLAAKYVGELQKKFSMIDLRWQEWVIKSYNQGPGNTMKEKTKQISRGYADEYWNRFQRNFEKAGK